MEENIQQLILEISKIEKTRSINSYNKKGLLPKVVSALNEIELNRNHSWAVEMFERNKNNLGNVALKYRGRKITYLEMFNNSVEFAKSLKQIGYKKGDEIPMCITNIPEFMYMFIASSLIGAKTKVVADWFSPEYLVSLLNDSNSHFFFVDDISYEKIKDSIDQSMVQNVVCFSITDSLKNGINPYQEIDDLFHEFKNKVSSVKIDCRKLCYDLKEFLNIGKAYNSNIVENVDLDDVCSITYTSGTTKPGFPKGVLQSNRSYITLSRFKESDVSGMPTMKNMSVLAHIPTDTHMELSCAISDTFYCGCELDLEPFYDKDFFPYSLMINKPNFVPASAGFWGTLCKKLAYDPIFEHVKMPFLMIPTVTGEGLSDGEEKFFNQISRKHKFGIDKLPFPLSPVTFSIGGGTTESSGIFVTLYKSLQEKALSHLIKKEKLGLTPHKFADIQVLDSNGNYCKTNEPGLLVANSPCEMTGYYDETLNEAAHITDAYGKKWLSLGTYSYKDSTGRIKMKGRMGSFVLLSDESVLPYYYIEDVILKDTKNVMSCSVVKTVDEKLVCHIELQPYKIKSENDCFKSIIERIEQTIPEEVKNKLFIRIRDNIESFPLDPSGKRSLSTLIMTGVDNKTFTYNEFKNTIYHTDKKEEIKILKLK